MISENSARCVGIIQARVGSTRRWGKVVAKLNGQTFLEFLVQRMRLSRRLDDLCVATSPRIENHPIIELCRKEDLKVFAPNVPEEDVLGRYCEVATQLDASTVVRITADNPFTDPFSLDQMISVFYDLRPDYVYSDHPSGLPSGLCSEVISREALRKCQEFARSTSYREHVTTYIWDHKTQFRIVAWEPPPALRRREVRITMDTEDDLQRARKLYAKLGKRAATAKAGDILRLFDERGNLRSLEP